MKLVVDKINKKFGRLQALENFSAEFESGHIYGLIGRNGAGKSTLLNVITDRVYPDDGLVTIDGNPVKNKAVELEKIHLMSDAFFYFTDERCEKLIKWISQIKPNFNKEKATALASKFGLNTKKTLARLSTGYRTIFKDIIALSMNTPFVFFDEPTLGLDAIARNSFYNEVANLFNENPEVCIVISTHLIDEIEPLVDRFYMIKDGKNLISGDKDDVLLNLSVVRGREEAVKKVIDAKKVISSNMMLGSYEVLTSEKIEEEEGVEVFKPTLQELFIKMVGGENK